MMSVQSYADNSSLFGEKTPLSPKYSLNPKISTQQQYNSRNIPPDFETQPTVGRQSKVSKTAKTRPNRPTMKFNDPNPTPNGPNLNPNPNPNLVLLRVPKNHERHVRAVQRL